MLKLGDLLGRFSSIGTSNSLKKETILAALEDSGIKNVASSQISITGRSIKLKTTPLKKSEVFLKQDKIMKFLKDNPTTSEIDRII